MPALQGKESCYMTIHIRLSNPLLSWGESPPGKELGCIAPNTTKAHNQHFRRLEFGKACIPNKQMCSLLPIWMRSPSPAATPPVADSWL